MILLTLIRKHQCDRLPLQAVIQALTFWGRWPSWAVQHSPTLPPGGLAFQASVCVFYAHTTTSQSTWQKDKLSIVSFMLLTSWCFEAIDGWTSKTQIHNHLSRSRAIGRRIRCDSNRWPRIPPQNRWFMAKVLNHNTQFVQQYLRKTYRIQYNYKLFQSKWAPAEYIPFNSAIGGHPRNIAAICKSVPSRGYTYTHCGHVTSQSFPRPI